MEVLVLAGNIMALSDYISRDKVIPLGKLKKREKAAAISKKKLVYRFVLDLVLSKRTIGSSM
jgi:hypothetical protein